MTMPYYIVRDYIFTAVIGLCLPHVKICYVVVNLSTPEDHNNHQSTQRNI